MTSGHDARDEVEAAFRTALRRKESLAAADLPALEQAAIASEDEGFAQAAFLSYAGVGDWKNAERVLDAMPPDAVNRDGYDAWRAWRRLDSGSRRAAADLWRRIAETAGDEGERLRARAALAYLGKDYAGALRILEDRAATERAATRYVYDSFLIPSLMQSGRWDRAEAECLAALRTMPEKGDLLYLYGYLQEKRGRPRAAADACEMVLRLDIRHAHALRRLFWLRVRGRRFRAAGRLFRTAYRARVAAE